MYNFFLLSCESVVYAYVDLVSPLLSKIVISSSYIKFRILQLVEIILNFESRVYYI